MKFCAKRTFVFFFHMFRRIDANDTALESYGQCATFLYINVFLIPYGLKMNSNTVKFDFERNFFLKVCRNEANNISLERYRKYKT